MWRKKKPILFQYFNSAMHIIRSLKHIQVYSGELAEKSKMICNFCTSIWFTCYLINNLHLNATYELEFEKKNCLLSILYAFYTHWLHANLQLLGKILWQNWRILYTYNFPHHTVFSCISQWIRRSGKRKRQTNNINCKRTHK